MREIELTQSKVALVDDEDYELISRFKWCAVKLGRTYYAQRVVSKNNKDTVFLMHRVIFNATKFIRIDHKNGNGLDNRKENLRIVTAAQNMFNRRPNKGKRFKGIRFCEKGYKKKYRASIKFQRKEFYLGNYLTIEEAARAYDKKAVELFGEFARLNFPNEKAA